MESKDFARQLESLAALEDPVRRRLYLYVAGRDGDVSRDQAARGLRITRALAAFHLDRLVEADLLQATFRRLSGKSGPGAGRPSKVYRRSDARFDLSLPRRRYELAAHVFSQALLETEPEGALDSLRRAGHAWGRRLAAESRSGGRGEGLARATRALASCGYEPRKAPDSEGGVVLRNCPFESLRSDSRGLICEMNLALIEGLIAGLEVEGVHAHLEPREGACCVTLRS